MTKHLIILLLASLFSISYLACTDSNGGGNVVGSSTSDGSFLGTSNTSGGSFLGTSNTSSSCTDTCVFEDSTQCNAENNIETCQADDDGCLSWVLSTTCDDGQTCGQNGDQTECIDQNITLQDTPARNFANCDDVCAEYGFTCSGQCEYGAGRVKYGYYSANGSIFLDGDRDLATCSEDIQRNAPCEDGGECEAIGQRCCCETHPWTIVEGDIDAPTSCDDTCAQNNLQCSNFYSWNPRDDDFPALNGQYITHTNDRGSTSTSPKTCSAVAQLTRTIGGQTLTLSEVLCACH